MNPIETLKELFTAFPSIGKRQAERFVYFLLRQDKSFHAKLIESLSKLEESVSRCEQCQQFFAHDETQKPKLCGVCSDSKRDSNTILILSSDADYHNIEQHGDYTGVYFILGGTVPILEKDPEKRIRITELKSLLKTLKPKEVILGLSTSPEGENTREYVQKEISKLATKITTLGRGLSTGAELEYSDPDTIQNALSNRN